MVGTKPDWEETSSQERIIGVTKTVDIEVTRATSKDGEVAHRITGQDVFNTAPK